MKRLMAVILAGVLLSAVGFLAGSCARRPQMPPLSPADSAVIVQENIARRAEIEEFFRTDPGSPFIRDTTTRYHGIRWFPIDPRFRGHSLLHRYADPETVTVLGTKGEQRRQLRYGYFEFPLPDETGKPVLLKLNVYKFTPYDGQRYLLYKDHLSIWFTDRTTGKETYGVGRYVDVGDELPDRGFLYTIDLNMAYNPYCAYSPMYSCAIPREEDHVDIPLRVGELKYHE
jgi:uncharacterized protein (DUF1684 family)